MKLRRSPPSAATPPIGYVGDHADKLSRLRAMRFEDERPCREDLEYGQTLFTRVPRLIPRFLRGSRARR